VVDESKFIRTCSICGKIKPIKDFVPIRSCKGGIWNKCRECHSKYVQGKRYETGKTRPLAENKDCSLYLGVGIAEKLLSEVFKNVARMPMNNRGYDFICGRGKKVDAKSACVGTVGGKYRKWTFRIRKNTIADYFACIAFENRNDLYPVHFWLIPGEIVSHVQTITILDSEKNLSKWKKYERPINKLVEGCMVMKFEGIV